MNNQTRNTIIFKVQDIIEAKWLNCDFDILIPEVLKHVKKVDEVTEELVMKCYNETH